ncbi:CRISPR-associated ring nuclease Csm6 [Photobacterium aquae]|uniref:CRISPR-associated ring nuclease Csm6 n=1 Tax=Photobacterium aquae TaxID=1195763 RepID=UPI00069D8F0E|nr:CRISPR-associated ring nuclease Csm6 [Photobacterium aquae]
MTDSKKTVLLAVTGLSPQIVTETLFGIHQAKLDWPDEIQIITTKKGKEQAELGLITTQEGKKSRIEQLCEDYGRPVPTITSAHIQVVPGANGSEVDDARSFEDQEALADFIVQHVASLCNDKNKRIHASLAGGRKTMTFFLGYAMTLFARPGDRLSHVLVEEAFEGLRGFYYPTPYTQVIEGRGDNEHLDAKKAKVTLAEIPFIRQRDQLNKNVLKSLEEESYREMVKFQNAINERDKIELKFNFFRRSVSIYGKEIDFFDNTMELAFFAMIARQVSENGYSDIKKPLKESEENDDNEVYDKKLTDLFLQELERLSGNKVHDYQLLLGENDSKDYVYNYKARTELLMDADLVKGSKTFDELKAGMTNAFFADRLTKLKSKLNSHFPSDFTFCILPAQVYDKDEPTQLREFGKKGRQGGAYGLWIKPENIRL